MTYAELKTIRDFIRFAVTRFNANGLYFGHGTNNAWDEAVALILHSLHLPPDINKNVMDAMLIQEERDRVLDLINQRVEKRIPVPYLTHEAWFADLHFYIDERVLIPRSSIAELIENHFQPWIEEEHIHAILDLCTGSACIAIACAKHFPEAEIDASDISHEALAVAKINVLRHSVEDQVHLYESDLFSQLPQKKYDVIVSNPPYVSSEEMRTLPQEYLYEPALGLAGGESGLDYIQKILLQAKDYLHPHGLLIVEVGSSERAMLSAYPNLPLTWLTFERSEGGVFLMTAQELAQAQTQLKALEKDTRD